MTTWERMAHAELRHEASPPTERELEVLSLVASGKSTKEIAHFLGVSVRTAESHRMRIMTKLHAHNTADLTRAAIRMGLIEV